MSSVIRNAVVTLVNCFIIEKKKDKTLEVQDLRKKIEYVHTTDG